MRQLQFFPVTYSGCVTIGVTKRGLYLAPLLLFRFLHPPLLLEWKHVASCDSGSFLWWTWQEVQVRTGGPTIRIHGSLGEVVHTAWRNSQRPAPAA